MVLAIGNLISSAVMPILVAAAQIVMLNATSYDRTCNAMASAAMTAATSAIVMETVQAIMAATVMVIELVIVI